MTRRPVPEPPRHATARDTPRSRLWSLLGLPVALALFALVGLTLHLASPDPKRTAADVNQPTVGPTPSPRTNERPAGQQSHHRHHQHARQRHHHQTHHHHAPRIPTSWVKVPKSERLSTSFNVVSFNALGFSHTARGGDRKGWRPGTTRMRSVVPIIHALDASVIGFQEFQGPQYAVFHAMAPEFDVYPGMSMGADPVQNSIAWRTTDWTLVRAQTTPIPYFYNRVAMPQVLLRNVHTGREVWFGNFHNPADKFHPAQGARVAATAIEAAMARGFVSDGYPVIYTGDMNERDTFFCRMSLEAPFYSADGAHRDATGCHNVSPTPVDWIIGTHPIVFSGYLRDTETESRRLSDHFLIKTTATLPAQRSLTRCRQAPHDPAAVFCPPHH